ncbi:MAG: CinA family protein [Chloroflexota bacterium]|nr:CinA family protein [Chloroflexota bacterium]
MTDPRPADLAARAVAALTEAGLTLSCAEADTGGGIGAALIDVAGVSRVFRGGVIAYANGPKRDLLGVPDATLRAHGSVSEETTLAMAEGARRVFATDVAIAQSGVTGPGGGTPERPVGTVWIACAGPGERRVLERHVWPRDRAGNKQATIIRALEMLLEAAQAADG